MNTNRINKIRTRIEQDVKRIIKERFYSDVEFETIWPVSKWETAQSDDMDFTIELELKTGKVISIKQAL